MACISPPELDDQTLLVFLDGHAPATTVAHIERCAHCRTNARQLAHLQDRLTTLLYRFECPSPTELGEYHLGILPAAAMEAIEHHLPNCLHCRREIDQLETYLTRLEPATRPDPLQEAVERARVWVARLVSSAAGGPAGLPAWTPAYAGLRGETSSAPLTFDAKDAQIIVEIKADAARPDRWAVLGLVVGVDKVSDFGAQLWQDKEQTTTAEIDELGNFVLTGLSSGEYRLLIIGPDLEIHIQQIQVGRMEYGQQDDSRQ